MVGLEALSLWMGENSRGRVYLEAGARGQLAGPAPPSAPGSCMTREPGQPIDIMKHEDQEPRLREEEGLGRKGWILGDAKNFLNALEPSTSSFCPSLPFLAWS